MSYIKRLTSWATRHGARRLLGHVQNVLRGWVWRQGGRIWRRLRSRMRGVAIG